MGFTSITEEELPFDIPESWEWVRLNELASITSGGTPSRTNSTYWNGNIPWVKISDISSKYVENIEEYITLDGLNNSSAKIFPKGTLLYTIFATIGTVGILNIEAATNQAIAGINFYGEFNLDYMYYVAVGLKELLVAKGKGMAQMNINQSILKSTPIPIPPLAEQQRIVDKIEELLPLVEEYGKAETRLKELNADFPDMLRKSILQQAVQGKLTERNPEDEPASELLKRIQAEKAQLIKDGKLKKEKPLPPITEEEIPFDIPDTWEWVRMSNVIDVRDGTHDSPEYVAQGYPFITGKDFYNGYFHLEKTQYISKADYLEIIKRSKVDIGDILFSMIGGNIGSMIRITTDNYFEMAIKNVALFKQYIKSQTLSCYLFYYLKSQIDRMKKQAKGGAQPFVPLNLLRAYPIPLPPLEEQNRIVARVEELLALCDQLK